MTLHKLNESTAFSRRNLDISDFTESLKKRTKLVFSHIPRKTSDEDGSVVGIGKLIHRLRSAVVSDRWVSHRVHSYGPWVTRHGHPDRANSSRFVFWSGGGNPHRTITAIDTLHLGQGALLVALVGKPNEAIAAGHATNWIGQDLC